MKHILDLTLKDSRFLNARNILMKFTAEWWILMNNETLKEKIYSITSKYPIKKVTLFGSRAEGTNRDDSDVDLIMEFSIQVSLLMLSQIRCDLEEILGLDVDIIHGPIRETDMIEIGKMVELYAA